MSQMIKTSIALCLLVGMNLPLSSQSLNYPIQKEDSGYVSIQGFAIWDNGGVFPVSFFPSKWNPQDSLREGNLDGILLRNNAINVNKVCEYGFEYNGYCIWHCKLILEGSSAACLEEGPDWISWKDDNMKLDSRPQREGRSIKYVNCLYSPFVKYSLSPLKHGSNRLRNQRLRRALEAE